VGMSDRMKVHPSIVYTTEDATQISLGGEQAYDSVVEALDKCKSRKTESRLRERLIYY
jgi:hypothetical protein